MEFKAGIFSLFVPKNDGNFFDIVKEENGKKYYLSIVEYDINDHVFICDWKLNTDENTDDRNHNSDFEDFLIYRMLKLRKIKLYFDDTSKTDQNELKERALLQLKIMSPNVDGLGTELSKHNKLIRINCKFEGKNIEAVTVIDSENFIEFINQFSSDIQVKIFEEISKDEFNRELYDNVLKKSIESYYKS